MLKLGFVSTRNFSDNTKAGTFCTSGLFHKSSSSFFLLRCNSELLKFLLLRTLVEVPSSRSSSLQLLPSCTRTEKEGAHSRLYNTLTRTHTRFFFARDSIKFSDNADAC